MSFLEDVYEVDPGLEEAGGFAVGEEVVWANAGPSAEAEGVAEILGFRDGPDGPLAVVQFMGREPQTVELGLIDGLSD